MKETEDAPSMVSLKSSAKVAPRTPTEVPASGIVYQPLVVLSPEALEIDDKIKSSPIENIETSLFIAILFFLIITSSCNQLDTLDSLQRPSS